MRKPSDSYIYFLFALLRQKRERAAAAASGNRFHLDDPDILDNYDNRDDFVEKQPYVPPSSGYRMSALKFAEGYIKPRYK
jgi:hypothetical protein